MRNELASLREKLGHVNAEWRDLSRQRGSEAKLARMDELRTQRLALITAIFNLEKSELKAG